MFSSDLARLVYGYLSEQGLNKTRDAFSKESPHLLESDVDNDMNKGQKLSSIIEEYFLLKRIEKRGKSADPESVLLLLWKQFDVLVGQLKHTTIYNSEKEKSKAKRTIRDQKARVRELNKQNWEALQQKNKSIAAANRDAFLKQTSETVNGLLILQPLNALQCSSQTLSTAHCSSQLLNTPQCSSQPFHIQSIPITPNYRQPINITPTYNVSYNTASKPPESKTRSKNVKPARSGRVKVLSENIQEVNSSERIQCSNDQLLLADQLKSPKRKSVPPKKRTGDIVPAVPATQISKLNPGPSTQTSTQEDLDIQSIVDKILHRPELPEKLAESINRAVEIDAPSSQQSPDVNTQEDDRTQMQQCPPQQNVVVDKNKVDDIMEMMKSDPVFEELFSCFENFESSCEESDIGQTKDNESRTSPKPSSASPKTNEPATEALDALLLLASSPVRSLIETSGSLETPQKNNGSAVFNSPLVRCASPVPVILSPGNLGVKRQSQPILSHIRQLSFTGVDETSAKCSKDTPMVTVTGIKHTENNQFSAESRKEQVSEQAAIPDKETIPRNTSREQSVVAIMPETENTQAKDSQCENPEIEYSGVHLDQKEELVELNLVEEKDEIEQAVKNNSHVLQKEQKKPDNSLETIGYVNSNVTAYKDMAGETPVVINVSDTDDFSGKEERKSFKDSPLKLSALEDLATNELLHCKTVTPTDTEINPLTSPDEVTGGSVVEKVDEEGCDKTTEMMLCESTEAKDFSMESRDGTATEVSEGCMSSTEGRVSNVGRFTNITTPESNKTPTGDDLTSSTESNKPSKRKKKKKSKTMSKKAKIIPEDLDVDKFLSQLHYLQEEKT